MIFTKLILFIFIFAILFLIKEGFMFYMAVRNGEKNITTPRLWGIGVSLAYALTVLITGFGL